MRFVFFCLSAIWNNNGDAVRILGVVTELQIDNDYLQRVLQCLRDNLFNSDRRSTSQRFK